jgi:hypothetical protein
VRGAFIEGKPAFAGSGIRSEKPYSEGAEQDPAE